MPALNIYGWKLLEGGIIKCVTVCQFTWSLGFNMFNKKVIIVQNIIAPWLSLTQVTIDNLWKVAIYLLYLSCLFFTIWTFSIQHSIKQMFSALLHYLVQVYYITTILGPGQVSPFPGKVRSHQSGWCVSSDLSCRTLTDYTRTSIFRKTNKSGNFLNVPLLIHDVFYGQPNIGLR